METNQELYDRIFRLEASLGNANDTIDRLRLSLNKRHSDIQLKIAFFIDQNRKICWEAEYENGEFCIGENKVKRFISELI
jgi:hypothetical protein